MVFNYVKPFETSQFPTDADVIKEILYHLRNKDHKKDSNKSEFKRTAQRVKDIWIKTGIPIIADTSIERKVSHIYDEYLSIIRKKKRPHLFNDFVISFRDKTPNSLFDISSCKCETNCHCPYDLKVPLNERNFYMTQETVENCLSDLLI